MRKSSESRAGDWDHKPIIWRRANVRFESKAGSCLQQKPSLFARLVSGWREDCSCRLACRVWKLAIVKRLSILAGFDELSKR